MSGAPAASSHYSHTCKPAHHSPPHPRSLHKSKKESDREGRRDPERKKCERLGGWENSPLDVCGVRCAQQQGDWHSGREMPTPGSWTVSCFAKGALCYIRYGITGEGAACDEAEAGWALQLRFVFLQHSCWGHYHMLLLLLLLHHCRSQMCALLEDWVQKSTFRRHYDTERDYGRTGLDLVFICVWTNLPHYDCADSLCNTSIFFTKWHSYLLFDLASVGSFVSAHALTLWYRSCEAVFTVQAVGTVDLYCMSSMFLVLLCVHQVCCQAAAACVDPHPAGDIWLSGTS